MKKIFLVACMFFLFACTPWRGEAEIQPDGDGVTFQGHAHPIVLETATMSPTAEMTVEPTVAATPIIELTTTVTPTATERGGTPRPTRTPEGTVEPTFTPVLEPTFTPTLESTPEPTLPPSEAIAPYPEGPTCSVHDPIGYHGLWNEVDGCHYDHTHFFDPHSSEVIAVFGDYTEYTGQEVSYPWQTFAGAMPGYPTPPVDANYENVAKHPGYKFDFYDFPESEYGCVANLDGIRAVPNAWLIERHSLGHKPDFMARVHSVWAMVRFCIPNAPGEEAWLFTGGWQDFGQRTSPYKTHVIPVPGNPMPPYDANRAPYIAHSCVGHADCRGPENLADFSWISLQQIDVGGHQLFAFGFRSNDSQQKLDATNGFNQVDPPFVYLCADAAGNYVAEDCHFNHSTGHTYQITGDIDPSLDMLDGVEDGRVNYEGWTDRWGNIMLSGCTETALDCVPVKIVNLPIGRYHINTSGFGIPDHEQNPHVGIPEYSICFLSNGEIAHCDTEGAVDAGWIGAEN